MRAETFFQMDYRTGEWKRLKKTRTLTPEEISGIQLCSSSQQPTVVVGPTPMQQPPTQQLQQQMSLHNQPISNNQPLYPLLMSQQFGQPNQQQGSSNATLNSLFQAAAQQPMQQPYQQQQQQQAPQFNLLDFAPRQQQHPQPGMQGEAVANSQAVYGVPGLFYNGGNRS